MKKRLLTAFICSLILITSACSNGKKYDTGNPELDKVLESSKEYKALDYVTLGEYKGVKVDVTASEEDVESRIQQLLDENKNERIKEGKVKDGDTVNIDFTGYMDGEAFDNGSGKDFDLEIGSNSFIPGFESGLIGVKVGATVDVEVTFPEDYKNNPDFSGKPATFVVTVNYIKGEEKERTFDDAFVQEITDNEYTSADAYREHIKEEIVTENKNNIGTTAYGQVISDSEIKDIPQFILDTMRLRLDANYKAMAQSYGYTDFNTFLTESWGISEEEYNRQMDEVSRQYAEEMLVTKAVAEKENIEIEDDEYNEAINMYMQSNGVDNEEDLMKLAATNYGSYLPDLINESIIAKKVTDLIAQNVVEADS